MVLFIYQDFTKALLAKVIPELCLSQISFVINQYFAFTDINYFSLIPFSALRRYLSSVLPHFSLLFFLQTLALKLKNTDLQDYPKCLPIVQLLADTYNVRLFQSKSVYEILWGYTDPVLDTIVNFQQSDACPGNSSKGVSSFVQLQVRLL